MFTYYTGDDQLYRLNNEAQEAHYWDVDQHLWLLCNERYCDLVSGFYYEEDDSHWIQTFREISPEEAELLIQRTNLYDLAYEIAKNAHIGQVDKAGAPYIDHPVSVASKMATHEAQAVALLHDVLEDTTVTVDDLRKASIPSVVIEAVVAITKIDGEDYLDYLKRVKENSLARVVKIADLEHNSDLSRLSVVTDGDLVRVKKYAQAIRFLSNQPQFINLYDEIYRQFANNQERARFHCLISGAQYTPPQPKKASKAQQKKAFREYLKKVTNKTRS